MSDIQLTKAEAKKVISSTKLTSSTLPWRSLQRIQSSRRVCAVCSQMRGGHFYNVDTIGWVCQQCWKQNQNRTRSITNPESEEIVAALVKKSKTKQTTKAKSAKKKASTIDAKAQPYIDAGLGEPFARAIARDESVMDSVMDLWEARWWKQYDVDDVLVCSVLEGILSEDDAKWLHTVREWHEDMMYACIHGSCTVEWSRALLDSGFKEDSQAVTSVLNGAKPELVSRIRKMEVQTDLLPPQLDKPANISQPPLDAHGLLGIDNQVEDVEEDVEEDDHEVLQPSGLKLDMTILRNWDKKQISTFCRTATIQTSPTKKMMFARLVDACEALFAFPVGFEFYPKLTTREIKKIASACSIAGRSNMSGQKLGSVLAKTYQKLREIAH